MRRTLYLNGHDNGLVAMRDGPSIWIKTQEKAGQRVPARFLGRVVIIGNVRLDSGVITLLSEHGIPVILMDNGAHESAMVIPYNHHLSAHYKEQKIILESDEHIRRYEEWAEVKREIIQMDVLKRLGRISGNALQGIGDGNYQKITAGIKPHSADKWAMVKSFVNNLQRALIMEHVIKADLDPHTGILHRRHNFGLVLDICHIMEAESDIQALQFFKSGQLRDFIEKHGGRWCMTNKGMHDIAHRFENRRTALHKIADSIIDELFELIRELSL